ncbi:MAG: hypothetical protein NUV69_03665 [Candidatus Curtissbacteria bacterium]|nr:hypothetical protein [Candidatus Curtissbacteria bacterium]
MKLLTRGTVGLLVLAFVAVLVPGSASAEINHSSTSGNLYGCMPDNVATRLVESGAFTTSGSSEFILCVDGYTAVYRVLP